MSNQNIKTVNFQNFNKDGSLNRKKLGELVFSDALGYIRNTLAFLKTNCKTDTCKQTINSKIESLKKANQAKYSQIKVNRIQFTQLVKMFIPST